ncbi:MAG: hypothetical protein NTW32_25845 [Chloroflexi bacterium]|nr:hypothetical protein [Chloroflexota bacterium]
MNRYIVSSLILVLFYNLIACSADQSGLATAVLIRKTPVPVSSGETSPEEILAAQAGFLTEVPENVNLQPANLKIVYEKTGNLWISNQNGISQLTLGGNDSRPQFSKDGNLVAFQRGKELWVANLSAGKERKLFGELGLTPLQFEFSDKNNNIVFTSGTMDGTPRFDLNIVDAENGDSRNLLPAGSGGTFTHDLTWETLTLVQPGMISSYVFDGSVKQEIYKFQPVLNVDPGYLPQIVWLENGYGFNAVVPAASGLAARFIFLGKTGGMTAQIAEFVPISLETSGYNISPDGSKIVYLKNLGDNFEMHVVDASTADQTYFSMPRGNLGILGWSPDSKNIIYWLEDPRHLWITSGKNNAPLVDVGSAENVMWLSNNSFLFSNESELRLLNLGHPSKLILTDITGNYDAISQP